MSIVLKRVETDNTIFEIRQEKACFNYELLIIDKDTLTTEKRYYTSLKAAKNSIRKKVS